MTAPVATENTPEQIYLRALPSGEIACTGGYAAIVSGGDAQLLTPRADRYLILLDAQAPQPDHNVHDGRPAIRGAIICLGSKGVQGGVGLLGLAKPAELLPPRGALAA